MALGITTGPFNEILSDQKVSVVVSSATTVIDAIYGSETITYSSASKNWIFFKHSSDIELKKFGIVDIGDAYVIMATTDSINFGDRIWKDAETFEFTPDCKMVLRYANNVALYRYYTLKKVG